MNSNLRDWLRNDKSFGMEVVVSSCDFWEILPVLIKGNKSSVFGKIYERCGFVGYFIYSIKGGMKEQKNMKNFVNGN